MRMKSFQLGGHDIKVRYLKTVRDSETGAEIFGLCNPLINEIHIATHIKGIELAEDVLKHTLGHEISHFMMIIMNENELNVNEKFVDLLGGFIHQWLKSAKWQRPK